MSDKAWWYLSFAGKKFNGGAVVLATDMLDAVMETNRLKINPHGEVVGLKIPEDQLWRFSHSERNRLLTKEECLGFDKKVKAKEAP